MSETAVSPTVYAYEKLMADNNLTEAQLPEDARIGILTIKNIDKMIKLNEKKGKTPAPSVLAKVKANDKWVVNEILDFLDDTDKNKAELPHDEEEVIEEIDENEEEEKVDNEAAVAVAAAASTAADAIPLTKEQEEAEAAKNKALGLTIEGELAEMFKSGKAEWHSDDIKGKYKNVYNTLFEHYEDGKDNGISTTNFSLLEKSEEIFIISKK